MADQRYKVLERIDAGGMAEVFKANSTSMQGFQKLVAIKRILPNLTQNERFVRMFLDEAKVSLHLNHTNCVHVFDLGIADGTYFIVMEFVDGTNLKKLVQFFDKHDQQMRVEDAVFIAIEICKGLTHAHEKCDQDGDPLDIVHRDISPPNILLSQAGEIKITDFGLAKAKSQAESTDPGVVKGKFGYLSPEAAQGEDIDKRTDIFAVGILLWEMLAGRRLFLGESDHETLQQVQSADITPISELRGDIPPYLEGILDRTLAKDPDDRYQTARQLGESLAEFLFDYGEVVTNYDIAELVEQYRQQRPERKKTRRDEKVGKAVQKQLDRLKSLEEIEDLDMYLAQHYESLPDQGEMGDPDAAGGFEDPRNWSDLGLGQDPGDGGADHADTGSNSGVGPGPDDSDSWQETGLDDLARSTSSYDAIEPLKARDAAEEASTAGGPPTLPGETATAPPPSQSQTTSQNSTPAPAPQSSQQPRPAQPAPDSSPAPQQPSEPDVTPRAERSDTSVDDGNDASGGLGPMATTLLVALAVVLIGTAVGFAMGLLPPG